MERIERWEIEEEDTEGLFRTADGRWMLDRRLTPEAIARRGLTPRSADLNLIGPDIVEVPTYLWDLLDLPK